MAHARPGRRVAAHVALFTAGVALWLACGIALESWPIVAANAVTLALAGVVLALKIRHR